ncbi:unnamed protein product [Toxocara canis]|uniref:Pyridoxamine 5'-phosphate oxidase family protein n=1 Tax=Toxocara canis TaxID=6265 RepID=A0A183UUH4_TOXCA|nr:unnamed protein product [Toxocara canis]
MRSHRRFAGLRRMLQGISYITASYEGITSAMATRSHTLISGHTPIPPRALWLSQDGNTAILMARTGPAPVGLNVEIGGSFKARVVFVDKKAGRVYVRPLAARKHHETLEEILNEVDTNMCMKPTEITPGYVYLVKVDPSVGAPFRGVITKEETPTHYTERDIK